MEISVVIATRNRKSRLISLLANLNQSTYPIHEVIIMDSSDEKMQPSEYLFPGKLNIIYLTSESSVCIQRNAGIQRAAAPWIFICDDDIEVPNDYLQKLADHITVHPESGAVSGIVLQQEHGEWKGNYPLKSGKELIFKYIFQLGIWGAIDCKENNFIIKKIKKYYAWKGNHITKGGWPVITHFTGEYFTVPAYGLGASLIRKEWLLSAPYDEVLDRHGIGDHYGVAMEFPDIGIHVISNAFVYHHHEPVNRLQKPLQYYRRVLALDYFVRTKKNLQHISRLWILWSLLGNAIVYFFAGDALMIGPALKTFWRILMGNNPYYAASKRAEKVVEPLL